MTDDIVDMAKEQLAQYKIDGSIRSVVDVMYLIEKLVETVEFYREQETA